MMISLLRILEQSGNYPQVKFIRGVANCKCILMHTKKFAPIPVGAFFAIQITSLLIISQQITI